MNLPWFEDKPYTLWNRKRFLLPVAYFPMNLVYPFTLRVTGINISQWCQKYKQSQPPHLDTPNKIGQTKTRRLGLGHTNLTH